MVRMSHDMAEEGVVSFARFPHAVASGLPVLPLLRRSEARMPFLSGTAIQNQSVACTLRF